MRSDRGAPITILPAGRSTRTVGPTLAEIRRELSGRDLACWCPVDQPCHADVLLELANSEA